jgi:hypothetical protein
VRGTRRTTLDNIANMWNSYHDLCQRMEHERVVHRSNQAPVVVTTTVATTTLASG